MAEKDEETSPVQGPFLIELEGIVRDFDPDGGAERYDVTFDCGRRGQRVEATVEIGAEGVTTLDIVPRAMAEMAKMFAALAEQSKAWTGGES